MKQLFDNQMYAKEKSHAGMIYMAPPLFNDKIFSYNLIDLFFHKFLAFTFFFAEFIRYIHLPLHIQIIVHEEHVLIRFPAHGVKILV